MRPLVICEKDNVAEIARGLEFLFEAFKHTRADIGEVEFTKMDLDDPFVEKALQTIADFSQKTESPVTVQELFQEISENVERAKASFQVSPLLFNTFMNNAVEGELFNLFLEFGVRVPGAPLVSPFKLNSLVSEIRVEQDENLFPLKSILRKNRALTHADVEFDESIPKNRVPKKGSSPPEPQTAQGYNVSTAAAFPSGLFKFNKDFIDTLLSFGHLKGIKPNGAKYASNGGSFPDPYAYLETIVLHEFAHYMFDDFLYQDIIPNADPLILNYAADFRINYMLKKSGYEQLPMGLFNDLMNLDRQENFTALYDLVREEFNKFQSKFPIPPNAQGNGPGGKNDKNDENGSNGGDGAPSKEKGQCTGDKCQGKEEGQSRREGKGKGGGDINDWFSKREDQHQQSEEEEAGKPGDQPQQDSGKKEGDKDKPSYSEDDINKGNKQNKDKVASPKKDQEGAKSNRKSSGITRGEDDYRATERRRPEEQPILPKFTWDKIVDKFVKGGARTTEPTRTKPARRNVTNIHTAAQLGAGALAPGERELSDAIKLAVIVDNSGSMSGVVPSVLTLLEKLVKSFKFDEILYSDFSDQTHVFYSVDFKKNIATELDVNLKKTQKKYPRSKMWGVQGGGTTLPSLLVTQANTLKGRGFNVLIVTDTDIVLEGNLHEVSRLLKNKPNQTFAIFATQNDYEVAVKALGFKQDTWTFFTWGQR